MSEYAEIIDAHSQHAREEVLAWVKSGLEVRRWNSVNPLTLERIIALAEDFDALAIEAQALRDQVKALQSDANSWQSGYDEGRRMGTKHRQDEVEQLTREVAELREKVKYQDAVIKQRNAECSRLFNEREALRSVAMDEEGAFDEWWESSGFYKFRETALAAWEARARLAATQGGPDHA